MSIDNRLRLTGRLFVLPIALVAALVRGEDGAATWSLSAGEHGTCPNTITRKDDTIVIDLSPLPEGAHVFRAVLRCRRDHMPGWRFEDDAVVVVPAGTAEGPLPLLAPRYRSLDATGAVAAALKARRGRLDLLVKSFRGWKPETVRLDVSFSGGKARNPIPRATALTARHRSGQTILTFREPSPPTAATELSARQFRTLRKSLQDDPRELTFRIYRSAAPITAATIAGATWVDEIEPLTCYNPDYFGIDPQDDDKLPRYVVEDGSEPVPPGTGIYAHCPVSPGKAHYAVSIAVAGEEDFTALGMGDTLREAVEETPGPGRPILQKTVKPETFFYTEGVTLEFYVRWEAPPRCNLPSQPYDYVVIVGPDLVEPAPLNLVMHCWGSNFLGKGGAYSWFSWKDRRIGIGVASNQKPYDWWTCYHENRETWKPWTGGVTRDFTAKRLLSFVDFVISKRKIDEGRLCVSGESMGGAGSAFMGIRYPDRFAYLYSSVGVHSPAAIEGGGFYESYARVCGAMQAEIKHESDLLTYDYLSDPLWVRKHPEVDLPFVGFGNGKNDHGIGWTHAVDLVRALQETRQPHAMIWNLRGHGAGTLHAQDLDLRRDRSLPAFSRGSLDDRIGTATKLPSPTPFTHPWGEKVEDIYDGDPEGQINGHLRWKTEDIVDRPAEWAVTLYLVEKAPADRCSVDVTPRRLQAFRVRPGMRFRWTNTSASERKRVQMGEAIADDFGLLTAEGVSVTKSGNRVQFLGLLESKTTD